MALIACGDVPHPSKGASDNAPDKPARDDYVLAPFVLEPTEMPEGLGRSIPFEDASGQALARFHEALGRARRGEGKARIGVWGASHTAADHWPGFLRNALQRQFGDAGRGFTLIAWPSDLYGYWQWGVEVAPGEGWSRSRLHRYHGTPEQYGPAGLAFDATDAPARSVIRTSGWGVGQRASQIIVLYLRQPGGGSFEVWVDDELIHTVATEAPEPLAGIAEVEVEDGPHQIAIVTRADGPVRLYGVALERAVPGVIVDNLALSGARLRNHLKWLDPTYTEHVRQRDFDLFILAYGGNESNDLDEPIARFRDEAARALERLRAAAPEASCLLLGPADKPLRRGDEWIHRPRTEHVAESLRTLAADQGCAFFDTVAFMGGPLSMLAWESSTPPLARSDRVHFSATGYRRLGEVVYEGLMNGFDD